MSTHGADKTLISCHTRPCKPQGQGQQTRRKASIKLFCTKNISVAVLLYSVCQKPQSGLQEADLLCIGGVHTLEAQAESGLPQLIAEAPANDGLTQATLCEGPPQGGSCGAQHQVVQKAPGQLCLQVNVLL